MVDGALGHAQERSAAPSCARVTGVRRPAIGPGRAA